MDGNPFEALVPRAAPPPQGNPFDALVPKGAAPPQAPSNGPQAPSSPPPSTDDLQSDSERDVAAMAPVTAGITDWIKGILAQPAPIDRAAEAAKRVEGEGGDVGAIIRDPDYRAASRDISTGFAMGSGLPERRAVPPPGEAPRGVPGLLSEPRPAEPAGAPKAEPAPDVAAEAPPAVAGPPAEPGAPSSAIPKEGPLARPPALDEPKAFQEQLDTLESNLTADKLDVMDRLKKLPDVPSSTWEKLYHYEEDPSLPLTAEERALYDEHVAPIRAEADQLFTDLERTTGKDFSGTGFEEAEGSPNYTPRYRSGKTRSFGEMLDQWKKGVEVEFGGAPGRSMRKTVDAQRGRRFYNAESTDTGETALVYVAPNRKVIAFDGTGTGGRPLGEFKPGQKLAPGSKVMVGNQTWKLADATTKEIEGAADVTYSKNLMANRLDNVQKLRSAVRNAEFIEGIKNSPDAASVMIPIKDNPVAPKTNGETWRTIKNLPQFRNYYVEPHFAEMLEDFAKSSNLDGMTHGLEMASNFVRASIFWNPIPHSRNVANHYFASKGLVGNILDAGGTAKDLLNAVRDVSTQSPLYREMLRQGASMPYAKLMTRKLHETMLTKLGDAVVKDPTTYDKVAKAFGYANPVALIKGIYNGSATALWSLNDAFNVAAIRGEMRHGRSMESAIRETYKHMPSYRIGTRVGMDNQMGRFLAQFLKSPATAEFGRYQTNRLQSYGHMVKTFINKELPAKERLKALDQMAAVATITFLYYEAADKVWQWISGNEHAEVSRPGASSVPQAAYDVATGKKDLPQGLSAVFSPGPAVSLFNELDSGRYGWNGQSIANIDDAKRADPQFLYDLATFVGSHIGPVGDIQRMAEGKVTPGQFGYSLAGVKTPTEQQVAQRDYFKRKEHAQSEHRAAVQSNKRAASPLSEWLRSHGVME